MIKQTVRFSLLLSAVWFAACGVQSGTATSRVTVDQRCATSADCPAGFECEVEHGVTASICASDDAPSGVCPAGFEAEVEHGQTSCEPHGGAGSGSGSGSGSGAGSGSAGCTTSADCPTGLECEIQVENGHTTSSCQPHGGH